MDMNITFLEFGIRDSLKCVRNRYEKWIVLDKNNDRLIPSKLITQIFFGILSKSYKYI